jgi:hypothetical protein
MAAEQGIIGQLMIEAGPGEPHQGKAASVMIAMTRLAALRPCIGFSVKSESSANICIDALVAGQALSILCLPRKGLMAGGAIGLELRVR